jgi:hypothetical protein
MKRIIYLILIGLTISYSLSAQTATNPQSRPAYISQLTANVPGQGQIQIVQDKKIDNLLSKYIENNSRKTTISGYRLRIFSESAQESARKRAYEAKAKFLSYFPDIEAYIKYESPDWKVYVGDFRSRTDAFRLKKQIDNLFPRRVFIVETPIEYTKL